MRQVDSLLTNNGDNGPTDDVARMLQIGGASHGSDEDLLGSLLREVTREIEADGLIAIWHEGKKPAECIFKTEDWPVGLSTMEEVSNLAARLPANSRDVCAVHLRGSLHENGELLTVPIAITGGVLTITILLRHAPLPREPTSSERLLHLLPWIYPCACLWVRSREMSTRITGLTAAVYHSGVATFLVNSDAEVLFANEAAERLIGQDDGICIRNARLSGMTLAETLRLQGAINHVCSNDDPAGKLTPVMALRRGNRRPLMAAMVSVSSDNQSTAKAEAVAYFFDPEQDFTPLLEPACKLYGLSPGEARLTCELASGASLSKAALALGVQEQTARSYLKQIFLKTATNRQAELVWLMLKSTVRTVAKGKRQFF